MNKALKDNLERANKFAYNEFTKTYDEKFKQGMQTGYIQGCIDQDTITKKEIIKKVKEAFCKSTCKGYQDIGRCLCDGNCNDYNQFMKSLEE